MPEARKKIIAGQEFMISQPYEAGHTLTEVEAKVLNQVRSENIANNLRKQVKEALENGGITEEFIQKVAEYDAGYSFALPGEGSTRRVLDPVEREARAIARDGIKAKLAETGRRLKDVDPAKLEAAIEQLIETNSEIMKLAKKRVAEKQKVTDTSLEALAL